MSLHVVGPNEGRAKTSALMSLLLQRCNPHAPGLSHQPHPFYESNSHCTPSGQILISRPFETAVVTAKTMCLCTPIGILGISRIFSTGSMLGRGSNPAHLDSNAEGNSGAKRRGFRPTFIGRSLPSGGSVLGRGSNPAHGDSNAEGHRGAKRRGFRPTFIGRSLPSGGSVLGRGSNPALWGEQRERT
jgi:hypothetical protein